jgi:hypothetical protein
LRFDPQKTTVICGWIRKKPRLSADGSAKNNG